jgi:hypothetical protein
MKQINSKVKHKAKNSLAFRTRSGQYRPHPYPKKNGAMEQWIRLNQDILNNGRIGGEWARSDLFFPFSLKGYPVNGLRRQSYDSILSTDR